MSTSIIGTGSYLPDRVLTNADLEAMVDTSDEWIVTRTGIKERHIARDDEGASHMAAAASRLAMADAQVEPGDVDLIIVATATPDMPFPSTACLVQNLVKARNAFCFDVSAACSGFLYALDIARKYVDSGMVKTALVVGAEKLSAITDWEDRDTCVLFGDGAGAVVVAARDTARGSIASVMGSDGALADLLKVPRCACSPIIDDGEDSDSPHIKMNGREVFKHAVRCMTDAAQQVLKASGMAVGDVDWVIPHQANMRIMNAIASRLDVPLEKFCLNLDMVGNMSAASIPVALDEAARAGKFKAGDVMLLVAFGGGFTWGASVLEWPSGKG
jgi:3-oxoacyl-[acyl-carrier-protein] synthase-3